MVAGTWEARGGAYLVFTVARLSVLAAWFERTVAASKHAFSSGHCETDNKAINFRDLTLLRRQDSPLGAPGLDRRL